MGGPSLKTLGRSAHAHISHCFGLFHLSLRANKGALASRSDWLSGRRCPHVVQSTADGPLDRGVSPVTGEKRSDGAREPRESLLPFGEPGRSSSGSDRRVAAGRCGVSACSLVRSAG